MTPLRLLSLLALVLLPLPSAARSGPPEEPLESLEAEVDALLAEAGFDGVVRLERPGSPPLVRARGLASKELGVANTASTRFKLHSLTKPFTSAAVLATVAEGKLALDQPVCGRLAPCPVAWSAVTVRHLLRHTSGIPDFTELLLEGFDADLATTLDALAPELEALALESEPGAAWSYSNSGYVLLARLLEEVDDKPFADVLAERVFRPAGLERTTLESPPPPGGYDGPPVEEGLASGYNGSEESPQRALSKMYVIPGAGGIVSTAADVARFSEALMSGRLLPPELLEEMLAVDPDLGVPAGLGVFVVEREGLGTVVRHDGGNNGYVASWQHLPETGVTLVVLSNEGFTDLGALRSAILTQALAASRESRASDR